MSDTTETTETPPEGGPEAKTFDAEYVKKLRDEAAKYRTEAKANADAAKRLAEIEESQKSEAEKAADRIRQLEEQAEAARRDALRFKVASKFGIGDEDVDLFLTASDEETLTKQAERLAARVDERKKQGNHVPREGTTPREPHEDELRAFTRNLFQKAD
jgi:uncharacterized membrane protein YqiK